VHEVEHRRACSGAAGEAMIHRDLENVEERKILARPVVDRATVPDTDCWACRAHHMSAIVDTPGAGDGTGVSVQRVPGAARRGWRSSPSIPLRCCLRVLALRRLR